MKRDTLIANAGTVRDMNAGFFARAALDAAGWAQDGFMMSRAVRACRDARKPWRACGSTPRARQG